MPNCLIYFSNVFGLAGDASVAELFGIFAELLETIVELLEGIC